LEKITYRIYENDVPQLILADIERLYKTIFQSNDASKIKKRLATAQDLCLQVAYVGDELAGFKIGYAKDKALYYSWLGAVGERFRGRGIAKELMLQQHDWCKAKGYERVQTKTMNRWKEMLLLNLRVGFDIVSKYKSEDGVVKIILEKGLTF
jgi:predicted GNAT superfamily acetyltransferase